MDYKDLRLKSKSHGLSVRESKGYEDLAIIENLDDNYNFDYLRPILGELKEKGRNHIIINLSKYSIDTKDRWMAFLEGAVAMLYYKSQSGYKTKYLGIEELKADWLHDFKDKVSRNLEEAVQSISH